MTLWNGASSILAQVRIFYQNIQSCVINNGLASEYFTLEQSVRQGDPLPTSLSWPWKPWQFQNEKILKCKELKLAIMKLTSTICRRYLCFLCFGDLNHLVILRCALIRPRNAAYDGFRSRLLMLSGGGFLVIIGSLV